MGKTILINKKFHHIFNVYNIKIVSDTLTKYMQIVFEVVAPNMHVE